MRMTSAAKTSLDTERPCTLRRTCRIAHVRHTWRQNKSSLVYVWRVVPCTTTTRCVALCECPQLDVAWRHALARPAEGKIAAEVAWRRNHVRLHDWKSRRQMSHRRAEHTGLNEWHTRLTDKHATWPQSRSHRRIEVRCKERPRGAKRVRRIDEYDVERLLRISHERGAVRVVKLKAPIREYWCIDL